MRRLTFPLITAAAGLLAGFFLGRQFTSAGEDSMRPDVSAARLSAGNKTGDGVAGQEPQGAEKRGAEKASRHAMRAATLAAAAVASGDMKGALRGLVSIKDPAVRMSAVQAFIKQLPKKDLPGLFEEFERMEAAGDFRQHQNMARAAASTWELVVAAVVEEGPESFLDLKLLKAGEQASETEFESVLSAWAERDLDATVAYFNTNIRHLTPSEMQGAAGHLASDFLRQDPDKALAWIQTLPEQIRGHCSHYAMRTLAQEDPAKAAAILSAHANLPDSDELARQVAQRWSIADPAMAFEWARGLSPDQSVLAVRGVMDQWMETDYDAASEQVSRLNPAQRHAALPGLVEKAPDDHLPVLATLLGDPPGDHHQTSAAASVASRWADKDAVAASEWLITQPAGPLRDSAIRGFTQQISKEDPESAFEWMAVISNPDVRSDTLDSGIRDWLDKDPEAARGWVQTSAGLTAGDRERLLKRTGK
jgi:hypothetical protein